MRPRDAKGMLLNNLAYSGWLKISLMDNDGAIVFAYDLSIVTMHVI